MKKKVRDPRLRKGEGQLIYEVRYARADRDTEYAKHAIDNLTQAVEEAQRDFPKVMNCANLDCETALKWFTKWFGERKA